MVDKFAGLPLWEHFIKIAQKENKHDEIALVKHYIEQSLPLLDWYINKFPRYTLHNTQHIYNIVKIMGELLGPLLENLSSLESAVLILSATLHDIGMVFKDDEIENISEEEDFKKFLDTHAAAKLRYKENNEKIDEYLSEWYCRSIHAKRVWLYINKWQIEKPLIWEGISIKDEIGNVCESHNIPCEDIILYKTKFKSNFLDECDLKFCCVLLRLADIFDFDKTRSPKSVYEYLELKKSENLTDKISNQEWLKHLNSKGFKFKTVNNDLKILYFANTKHPSIEHSIRKFIKLIESELQECNYLLTFCSAKWKKFYLPHEIEKEIKPDNYKYGDYTLSLSKEKVIDLLIGEGIYEDKYVCLRELIQNSIDTSKHRLLVEKESFNISPIHISYFRDSIGYYWIRIDDYGMGMNENIIQNHLLDKGNSYYKSNEFKLEKLKIEKEKEVDFNPISKFGIGLLSCFLIADKIEISTKYFYEQNNAYRLSIDSKDNYFVFQAKDLNQIPIEMPIDGGVEKNFRSEIGTSIAIRINRNSENIHLDFSKVLNRYIIASPIPIFYAGQLIGGNREQLLNDKWFNGVQSDIETQIRERFEKKFNVSFLKKPTLQILNVDLSKESLTSNLEGQFLIIYIDFEISQLEKSSSEFDINLKINDKDNLSVQGTLRNSSNTEHDYIDISFKNLNINIPDIIKNDERNYHSNNNILLSYNGIRYSVGHLLSLAKFWTKKHISRHSDKYVAYGLITIQNDLLPDLFISRDQITRLNFKIMAHLIFSLRELNSYIINTGMKWNIFDHYTYSIIDRLAITISNSNIYEKYSTQLEKLLTLSTVNGVMSIDKIILKEENKLEVEISPYATIISDLTNYILDKKYNVYVQTELFNNYHSINYFLSQKKFEMPVELLQFPPITFVFYNDSKILGIGRHVNLNHRFMIWYLRVSTTLFQEYNYYAKQLIDAIIYSRYRDVSTILNDIINHLKIVLPESKKPSNDIYISNAEFIN